LHSTFLLAENFIFILVSATGINQFQYRSEPTEHRDTFLVTAVCSVSRMMNSSIEALMNAFPSLSKEKAADYIIATVIAVLFPIVRYVLDKTVYHVR
jgi:hypothetical protein